jgi:flagellar assembly protein FliH
MALIKSSNARGLLKDAVVLDLGDIQRQADALLERARREAERIVADARAESQQLIDSASETGREEGLQSGLEEGREQGRRVGREEVIESLKTQLGELISNWQNALEQWERDREEMLLAAREDVLAFAFALGQKVTHRIIEADPTVVQDQLAEALSLLSRPSAVTITINPADREHVEQVLDELVTVCGACEHAELRDDSSIARGGCVLRTSGGEVDATIDTQLARIAEALLPWAATHNEQEQ